MSRQYSRQWICVTNCKCKCFEKCVCCCNGSIENGLTKCGEKSCEHKPIPCDEEELCDNCINEEVYCVNCLNRLIEKGCKCNFFFCKINLMCIASSMYWEERDEANNKSVNMP